MSLKRPQMPSQAAIEIASIFDNIFANNLKYCCVCLRTEEERKLVDPEHFLKCLRIMSVQVPLVKTICYVCESESTRAYALFQAINFASIINKWVKDITSKLKNKDEMPAYLERHISKQRRRGGAWPLAAWRRVRARSALVQTEVLAVSAAEEDDPITVDPLSPESSRPPEQEPPGSAQLESIVIIVDDDECSNNLPPPPLTASTPVPPPPLTPAPTTVLPGPTVPTFSSSVAELLNSNTIPNNASLIQNDMDYRLLNRQKDDQSGYMIQPLVLGTDGNYHILTTLKSLQQNQNQIEYQDDNGVLEVGSIASEQNDQSINITGVQTLNEGIVVIDEETDRVQEQVVKRPVMSGRIDWEDKIPMDVISFVDASDPLFKKKSAPQRPQTYPKPKRYKNDVIDLS